MANEFIPYTDQNQNLFDPEASNYVGKHQMYVYHKPNFHTNIKILLFYPIKTFQVYLSERLKY